MSAQWYYAIDDQESGPVSAQELKGLADSGQLKSTDQVWRDGMPAWVPAGSIKNLIPAKASGSPFAPTGTSGQVAQSPTSNPTAPAGRADEVRRAAAAAHDDDDLEVEAPIQRPAEAELKPTDVAAAAALDARRARKKTGDEEYLDYDEAFELGDQAKKVAAEASRDALAAFKTLLRNPVGGLDEAFAQLGPTRAIAVGVVFCVIFAACFFVAVFFLGAPRLAFSLGIYEHKGFVAFLKIGVLSLLSPLGIIAGCAASRAMFKGQGGFPSDVFLGGAALLPLAVFALVDGLLGGSSGDLVGIVLIFAFCTTVLMLYSGSTHLHQTPEAVATVAVPIMMLLCIFIPRVVAGAMF